MADAIRACNIDMALPIFCCLSNGGILNVTCPKASMFKLRLTILAPCSDTSI